MSETLHIVARRIAQLQEELSKAIGMWKSAAKGCEHSETGDDCLHPKQGGHPFCYPSNCPVVK